MVQDIDSEELLPSEKSDIYAIPNPDAAKQFLVVPGTVGVPEDGRKVWIRNLTDFSVEVRFPNTIGSGDPVTIPKGAPRQFLLKKAPVGIYEYTVYVLVPGDKVPAQGGSNPRIVYG